MTQILPVVPVQDFRERIEVDATYATDEKLQKYLDAAARIVGHDLQDLEEDQPARRQDARAPARMLKDQDFSTSANVAEAIAQIAVKIWDLRPRGVQTLDMDGAPDPPAMPATAGLVRSVRGLLLPEMATGGLTV
jgi:hypothetical protein